MQNITNIANIAKSVGDIKPHHTSSSSSHSGVPTTSVPSCKDCNDTGYYIVDVPVGDPRFGKAQRCPCKNQEDRDRRIAGLLIKTPLGRMANCTFDNFSATRPGLDPTQIALASMVKSEAQRFATNPQGFLVLSGPVGVGKSHLAAAIVQYRISLGRSALMISAPEMVGRLRQGIGSGENYLEQFKDAPLLVVDDLGAEHLTDWVQEQFYIIIHTRYQLDRPLVITTNQSLDSFEPRIRSRLSDPDFSRHFSLSLPDYRRGVGEARSAADKLHIYAEKSFQTFNPYNASLSKAMQLCMAFAERSGDGGGKTLLLLFGTHHACGKTHLAAAMANHVVGKGGDATMVYWPDFLDHLRDSFGDSGGGPNGNYTERLNRVRECGFLVIDGLNKMQADSFAEQKLLQIIEHRVVSRLPTCVTVARLDLPDALLAKFRNGDDAVIFQITSTPYGGRGTR